MGFKIWCQDGGGGTLLSKSPFVREFLNIWFCNFFFCFYWIHPIFWKLWKRFCDWKLKKVCFHTYLLFLFFSQFIRFCDIKDRDNLARIARCAESAQWDVNLIGDGVSKTYSVTSGFRAYLHEARQQGSSFKGIFTYSAHIAARRQPFRLGREGCFRYINEVFCCLCVCLSPQMKINFIYKFP